MGVFVGLVFAACAGGAPFPESWAHRATSDATRAAEGMVATTDSLASQVGLDILRAGGNAIDAAVAVQFALAVVNPAAGNIGGGGFLVVRLSEGETAALDFREEAPGRATRDMYLDNRGELTDASTVGHLASGVPGTVSGMWLAHQEYGSLPWEAVLDPAIELADGFVVRERFLWPFTERRIDQLAAFPASAAQFLVRGGRPPAVGETFSQPDLARTLRRIRDRGPDGFYRGETADLIVAEMERGGGIINHDDLAAYSAVWREPVEFRYRDHTVISMPPPSSGGATLAEIALILQSYDLEAMGWHSTRSLHVMVEAFRRAYADRNYYLADPDFEEMPLERMTSSPYGAERARTVDMEAATPSAEVRPGLGPARAESENTTHFSIVDAAGNAVAVTTTLNSLFGGMVTVAGAGFLLNNEMDDFSARPGFANQFGLVQGEQNAIEPGKRMLSAMTPTIVVGPDGELRMVTGSPGGGTIITTVFQTISNVVDFGMSAAEAVNAPRVHHQHLPDRIMYERGGLNEATVDALRALGHEVEERGGMSGDVQMILVGEGGLMGSSDPRRGGRALGY